MLQKFFLIKIAKKKPSYVLGKCVRECGAFRFPTIGEILFSSFSQLLLCIVVHVGVFQHVPSLGYVCIE